MNKWGVKKAIEMAVEESTPSILREELNCDEKRILSTQ